jgi:hypothetical protein
MLTEFDPGTDSGAVRATDLDPAMRDVIQRCPPPSTVRGVEVVSDIVEISELRVRAVGISAATETLGEVTGASADLERAPFDRAYFELLERLAVKEIAARSVSGSGGEQVLSSERRLSLSNGVALQVSSERAAISAALELVERDRVLRSWYGGARPERISPSLGEWSARLSAEYQLSVVRFREGLDVADVRATVVGIIAFPRSIHAPLSMGFAARPSLDESLQAASRELLQQIAFGWGEPVPSESPAVAPTPEFHLDFYSYPGHHALLEAWLDGKHEGRGPVLPDVAGAFRFTDITPTWMEGGLRVVRAEHPSAVPLVFGLGHPWFPELPECMRVQPIA